MKCPAQEPLSDRQVRLLLFIVRYHAEHGYGPTCKEIAAAVGLSSETGSVIPHLRRLRRSGLVDWAPGGKRTLHPLVREAPLVSQPPPPFPSRGVSATVDMCPLSTQEA
jgi:repressor LexA